MWQGLCVYLGPCCYCCCFSFIYDIYQTIFNERNEEKNDQTNRVVLSHQYDRIVKLMAKSNQEMKNYSLSAANTKANGL